MAQNRGLNHVGVIREIAAREGFTAAQVVARTALPPRYTLDEAENVVQVR